MNPLEQFLSKIQTFLQASTGAKKPLLSAIKNAVSIDLTEKDVEIKGGIAHVFSSPLVKNEIFMRKSAILKELQAQNITSIRDIR
jgi:hypothetical protein